LINKIINDNNYEQILNNVTNDSSLNNNIFKMIINIKFFNKLTKQKEKVLQTITIKLLRLILVDETKILVLIDKIKTFDDEIFDEMLRISAEKNFLLTINKLRDYDIENVDEYFYIALNNKSYMAAAMISNYDLCDYIDEINYFEDCEDLLNYIDEGFLYVVKNYLLEYLDDEDEINSFIQKYNTYLTRSKVDIMTEDILDENDD
jgi:hypothetical protein